MAGVPPFNAFPQPPAGGNPANFPTLNSGSLAQYNANCNAMPSMYGTGVQTYAPTGVPASASSFATSSSQSQGSLSNSAMATSSAAMYAPQAPQFPSSLTPFPNPGVGTMPYSSPEPASFVSPSVPRSLAASESSTSYETIPSSQKPSFPPSYTAGSSIPAAPSYPRHPGAPPAVPSALKASSFPHAPSSGTSSQVSSSPIARQSYTPAYGHPPSGYPFQATDDLSGGNGSENSYVHYPPPSVGEQPRRAHQGQLNGSYPGGMGSMQQEFSQMGFGVNQPKLVDLIQERNLLRHGMEDTVMDLPPSVCNPEVHCSSSVFRCTLGAIPQTQELLKKSRLPFGLTLQPFRDIKNLNVIQTSTIVRCRYCRTYINPYVYLTDSRHWKCNLCYRVNDLPDDFSWDPVSKSYGEPTRRPEIKFPTVEFIAPSEYMLRPPQPAVYVFIFDVTHSALESGYLYTFSEQLLLALEQMPGDDRTLIGFIGVDSAIHFFQFNGSLPPRQLIVDDFDDPFLPVNTGLLVNLRNNLEVVRSFVQSLPSLYESNTSTSNCLGAALNAAHELIEEIGGRITVLQTVLPNIGPGCLSSREDPNQRASNEVQNLGPATDFYKRLALECTGHQVAIDLFLLNTQYADISTLSEMSKFSSGCIHHFPNYHMNRDQVQVKRFQKQLNRYLTRKIGFEAVLRIRCTKGLSLHTFHGNFFVRSTDLLALANVNPDSALGVQVQMEEDLVGLNTVCFQAALLYTSSKGDRRIRIHTLCLPITKDLPTVFNNFDAKASISLLAKMAVERSVYGGSLGDAREALVNAVVDALGAFNAAVSQGRSSSVLAPLSSLRMLPLFILGMLKHSSFSSGKSIKLDTRVASLLMFKTAPLEVIMLELFPALYQLDHFCQSDEDPPRLHLSFEHIDKDGLYLLDTGSYVYVYVASNASPTVLLDLFGVDHFAKVDEDKVFEPLSNPLSVKVHAFLRKLSIARSAFAPVIIVREDSRLRELFARRLIEDRTEYSHSYIEFLHHIRQEMFR